MFHLFRDRLRAICRRGGVCNSFVNNRIVSALVTHCFNPRPCTCPVVNDAGGLGGPQLARVRGFFRSCCITSGVTLVLDNSFSTRRIVPVLRGTFSQVHSNGTPGRRGIVLPPFGKQRAVGMGFPVPFVGTVKLNFQNISTGRRSRMTLGVTIGLLGGTGNANCLSGLVIRRGLVKTLTVGRDVGRTKVLTITVVPGLLVRSCDSTRGVI